MTLDEVVTELYGLAPEEFTTVRNERAKQAKADGDRDLSAAIGQLRKPSTGAWAVNLLAREAREQLDQLLQLGAAFREAAQALDGAELRELTRQRHQLVTALAREVRGLARERGRALSGAIADEVEDTLRAAMADPAAAEAVASGRLTVSLSSTGLGSVGLPEGVGATAPADAAASSTRPSAPRARGARPSGGGAPGRAGQDARAAEAERAAQRRREQAREQAQAAVEEARAAVAEARQHVEEAQTRVDRLAASRESLQEQVAQLQEQVRQLQAEAETTEREEGRARGDRELAARRLAAAEREERSAQARVDRLP